jgi:outer membrane immunogenic protein
MKITTKSMTVAAAVAIFGVPTASMADGLPRTYRAAPPTHSWSGFYAGLNAGVGWSDSKQSIRGGDAVGQALIDAFAAAGGATSLSPDGSGFIGGAQLGFNFQSGAFVWGVEADIQGANLDGDASSTLAIVPGVVDINTAVTSKLDWLGTLRLRGGVLVDPKTLIYLTGGLAYGRVEHSWNSDLSIGGGALVFPLTGGSDRSWETGWTVGGGAELALSRSVTLRGEYLYYDLGDSSYSAPWNPVIPLAPNTIKADNSGHVARAALNYRF